MSTLSVRPARPSDAPAVTAIVCAAYLPWIERIGRQPGPMLQDFAAVIEEADVHVAVGGGSVVGVIVTKVTVEGFYVDNVAILPSVKGLGIGRLLLEFAEAEARRLGFKSLYLATHERMTENRDLYRRIGYVQYDARTVDGFPRVFMRKML
jgi:GNAT superfamily N-acetyltransferase